MARTKMLWVVGAVVAAAATLSCSPKTQQFAIKYAEKRAVLDNGLRLVVIPDQNTPMVQVDVRYAVGANEDPPGKAGLAHYVEHMMFQWRFFGDDGPDLFTVLPQVATGLNAYTAPDRTHYWLTAPKEDVAKLLDIEARRMRMAQTDCEKIPDAEFTRELDVVRNEIRRNLGTASGLILPIILDHIFPEGHPYEQTPGGNDAQLVTITKADVCQFMRDYYTPSRATLVVAGNVDPDEVGKLVAGYFGNIPAGNPKPRVEVPPITTKKARVEKNLDIDRTQVAIAWSLPPQDDPDSIKGRLAAGALNARAARFAADWDFAASVGALVLGEGTFNPVAGPRAPVLLLFAELYSDKDVDKALDYLWKAAEGAHEGLQHMPTTSEEDIAIARARYIMSLESLSARTEEVATLIQFSKETDFSGETEYILDQLRQMDDVDSEDYKGFVKKTLAKDRGVVFVFHKDESGLHGDKRAAGKLGASADHYQNKKALIDPNEAQTPMTFPEQPGIVASAQQYTLGNGMRVVLLPFEGLPVVSMGLRFGVGSVHEDPDKAGLADLACETLEFPPGATVYGRLGAFFGNSCGMESTTFTVRGISTYAGELAKALERWIKAGVYDQEYIELWQERFGDQLKLPSVKVSHRFQLALAEALYGASHPYTTNGSPTRETYGKFGRDMLEDFRRKHYSASNATLIVAGQFEVEEMKSHISSAFGSWSKGHVDQPLAQPAAQRTGPIYIGVVGLDEQNTNIQLAYPGPTGIDDQYGIRLLASTMINDRMGLVRTQLGSTYGVYGRWSPSIGPSEYLMGGPVESLRAGESLAFMRQQIDALRRGENLEVDFVRARRKVMKQLLSETTESFRLQAALANMVHFDRPFDSTWRVTKQVATAKPEMVKNLIAAELPPEREVIVLLADKETLERTFTEIGVTDYTLIDPNAEPGAN